ncbi:MAG: hypothetical protein GXZ15_00095 [Campylobacter sp.]|nr:hypothetical protein [Campylobacter sp.]
MLRDLLYISAGAGLEIKDRVLKELKALEDIGKISKDDSKTFLKGLYDRGENMHNEHMDEFKECLKQALGELNLATKDDIDRIEKKIDKKFDKKA